MSKIKLAAIALLSLPMFSCASMMAGSESSVAITSTPQGVRFRTSTGQYGITPCHVDLPNGKAVTVVYKDPESGLKNSVISTPVMHKAIFGNILIGGFIGLAVDFVNQETRIHKDDIDLPTGLDKDLIE